MPSIQRTVGPRSTQSFTISGVNELAPRRRNPIRQAQVLRDELLDLGHGAWKVCRREMNDAPRYQPRENLDLVLACSNRGVGLL